jgi:hypothetical protein
MSQSDSTQSPSAPTSTRPPIKVAHLVFGCFFLGVAALWALTESGNLTWKGTSYLVPLTLLLAGVIGLTASLAGNATDRRRRTASYEPVAPATSSQDVRPETGAETAAEDTTVLPVDETEER